LPIRILSQHVAMGVLGAPIGIGLQAV